MSFIKRISLFFIINVIIIFTLSLIISILNLKPYITYYGLNYTSLLIFCSIWGMGGAIISLLLSKKIAIWMVKVKLIDRLSATEYEKKIFSLVETLSKKAGLKHIPDVGIYPSKDVNAFATGPSRKNSLIALSQGLLDRMKDDELEGVIAHEISHISNGDMVTMTLIQGIVNAFVMFLARILAYLISSSNRRNNNFSYFGHMMLVFFFQTIFMIFGSMVIFAFSRKREYKADLGGAKIAGKDKMIKALKELMASRPLKIKNPEKVAAIQTMQISNKTKKGFLKLFSTHPSLEDRIARLQKS